MTTTARSPARATHTRERRAAVTVPGLMVGIGLGGLVDGVIFHQVLQWHHMLTDYGGYRGCVAGGLAGPPVSGAVGVGNGRGWMRRTAFPEGRAPWRRRWSPSPACSRG
jgi:hypothetical protein